MSLTWCMFCLRPSNIHGFEDGNRKEIDNDNRFNRIDQFLKLFRRYTSGSKTRNEPSGNGNCGMDTCLDCSLVLQDFCDLYDKMKVFEIKLNWKLQTLKSIMKSADKVPLRLKKLDSGLEQEKQDALQKLKRFRKEIISSASKKLKLSLPKVNLAKWESPSLNSDNDTGGCDYSTEVKCTESKGLDTVDTAGLESTLEMDISEPFSLHPPMKLEKMELEHGISSEMGAGNDDDQSLDDHQNEDRSHLLFLAGAASFKEETELDHLTENGAMMIRRSKRKCVVERRQQKINTCDDEDDTDSEGDGSVCSNAVKSEGEFLTLKELALKHVMKLRYSCTFKNCKTFFNPHDLHRHSFHHGRFRCNFCKSVFQYAPTLIRHEIIKHSRKLKRNYKCPRCPFQNTMQAVTRHHLKTHLNLRPDRRTCGICHLPIWSTHHPSLETSVKAHYSQFHDLSNVDQATIQRCDMNNCRAYFRTRAQLSRHQAWIDHNHSPPTLKSKCGPGSGFKTRKTFWDEELSLSPQALEKLGRGRTCEVPKCGKVYYSDADFERHSKLHGKFECEKCEIVFNHAKTLFSHEMTHQKKDVRGECCPRCEYAPRKERYQQEKVLNHFLDAHLDLNNDHHTCPVCNAKLMNNRKGHHKNMLRFHLQRNHDYSKTHYKCEEPGCHAYFNSHVLFTVHRNKHKYVFNPDSKSKRKYQCKTCLNWFTKRSGLIMHVRKLHLKDLPYVCPSDGCGERFKTVEELEIHTTGNQVVKCKKCEKSYHSYAGLVLHMKVHSGVVKKKPPVEDWICEICGKKLANKATLEVHHLSHSGPDSWRFSCDICGKKLMTNAKLVEHKRTHSKEKPYTCEFCGTRYAHRHNLRHHISNKHGELATNSTSTKVLKMSEKKKSTSEKQEQNESRKNSNSKQTRKIKKLRGARKRRRSPSLSHSDSDIDE